MVISTDENAESSSALHIRRKRMNYHPGSSSSSSHALQPWFGHLGYVNINNPTPVQIISEDSTEIGYAIHPYFVLTRRDYVLQGFRLYVFTRNTRNPQFQHVRICYGDNYKDVVLIKLTDPIDLDNPVRNAFSAKNYRARGVIWAQLQVEKWIGKYKLVHFEEPPQKPLTELRLYDPTKVVMTTNGDQIGPGFAIHPHVVITSRNYMQKTVGVLSYTATRGQFNNHQIKDSFLFENIGVVLLHDPISLDFPVPAAFATAQFSFDEVNFANNKALEWIREYNTRMSQELRIYNRIPDNRV